MPILWSSHIFLLADIGNWVFFQDGGWRRLNILASAEYSVCNGFQPPEVQRFVSEVLIFCDLITAMIVFADDDNNSSYYYLSITVVFRTNVLSHTQCEHPA